MGLLNKFAPDAFSSLFSEELKNIFAVVFDCHFNLMFVGGCTRNYLTTGSLAYDLDAELRPADGAQMCRSLWEERLLLLRGRLKELGHHMELAGVGVYKIQLQDCDLEFSTPRTEVYREGEWGHSNFDAHFNPNLETIKAFERRDFTINAIGFLLSRSGVVLEDPFEGVADLEQQVLKPVSALFHRDPVRILRALRFCLALDFSFGKPLITELKLANFSELTNHYIALEAKKVGIIRFLAFFQECQKEYHWQLPKSLMFLNEVSLVCVKNSLHSQAFPLFCILFCTEASTQNVTDFALVFGFKQREIKLAEKLIKRLRQESELTLSNLEYEKLEGFGQGWMGPIANQLLRKLSQRLG